MKKYTSQLHHKELNESYKNANKSIQKYVSRQSYKKDRYTLSGEESITSAQNKEGHVRHLKSRVPTALLSA